MTAEEEASASDLFGETPTSIPDPYSSPDMSAYRDELRFDEQILEQSFASDAYPRELLPICECLHGLMERIKEARFLTDEELREELIKQGLTLEEYRKRDGTTPFPSFRKGPSRVVESCTCS